MRKSFPYQLKTWQTKSAKIIFLRQDEKNIWYRKVEKHTNVDVFNFKQLDFHKIISTQTHHFDSQAIHKLNGISTTENWILCTLNERFGERKTTKTISILIELDKMVHVWMHKRKQQINSISISNITILVCYSSIYELPDSIFVV